MELTDILSKKEWATFEKKGTFRPLPNQLHRVQHIRHWRYRQSQLVQPSVSRNKG